MTETSSHEPAALALENVGKRFGSVIALSDVSMSVPKNQVTCVLGDNGAGKSTLIKILSGVHTPSDGQMFVNGEPTTFGSPREALDMGIATVFQDLATVPLMAVWRNFYLGNEPTRGFWPFKGLRTKYAKESCKAELADMGIDIRDTEQPVGTLSGGSARRCRLPALCTSVPTCSSSTSPPVPSVLSNPASFSSTSETPPRPVCPSCSSPTTHTMRILSVTTSICSIADK